MQFLQGIIWTNDVTRSLVKTWAQRTLPPFQSPLPAYRVKSPCVYCIASPWIQKFKGAEFFYSNQSRTGKKILPFYLFCVFQKPILFFGNTSFLYLVGADIFICMYICWCVYICIQCKGSIYSLHAAGNVSLYSPPWAPDPAAARGQQASSPTTTCKAMVASQTSLECGNKTENVQDLAAFLLVYKLFEKMTCLVI